MSEQTLRALAKWRTQMDEFLGTCLQSRSGQTRPALRALERDGHFVDLFIGGSSDKRHLEPMTSAFSDAVAFTYWVEFRLDRRTLTVHESSFAVFERTDSSSTPMPRLRIDYEREKAVYHQSHVHFGGHDFHIPIGHTFFRPTFEDLVLAALAETERAHSVEDEIALAIRSTANQRLESWYKLQTRRAVRARPKVAVDERVCPTAAQRKAPLAHFTRSGRSQPTGQQVR